MRRQHVRAEANLTVVDHESPGTPSYATRDLGIGGLFVLTAADWVVGGRRKMTLVGPTSDLALEVLVLRPGPGGYAVSFLDLDDISRAEVERLVRQLLTEGATLDEKRRAPRLVVDCPVRWSDHDLPEYLSVLVEISYTGATLVADPRPEIGTVVTLWLPVEGAEPRESNPASVIRHTKNGFAVRFERPGAAFCDAISAIRRAALAAVD